MSTFVTSGSSMGSGGGTGAVPFVPANTYAETNEGTLSLTASLTSEPLKPTRDTPAMTVTSESHLGAEAGAGQRQDGDKRRGTHW